MMGGWICLHRGIVKSAVFEDPMYLKTWLWLLLSASHKPTQVLAKLKNGRRVINLDRGQLSHSRSFIARAVKWSERSIRTCLTNLQTMGMIDLQTDQGQMVITICNYEKYQDRLSAADQQSDQESEGQTTGKAPSKRPANDQNKNNDNNENNREGVLADTSPSIIIFPTPLSSEATPLKKRRAAPTKKPLPEGQEFSELQAAFLEYTATKKQSPNWGADQFERFCDHAKAKGVVHADWIAAGRTWIRNGIAFASKDRTAHGRGRSNDL